MHNIEPKFEFVHVNQDGTARELSPEERAYLSEEFARGDGDRPYIKSGYDARDGWGSLSGFINRKDVPAHIKILPVHPDYDAREKELRSEALNSGSDAIDTFETARRKYLDLERKREELALMPQNEIE